LRRLVPSKFDKVPYEIAQLLPEAPLSYDAISRELVDLFPGVPRQVFLKGPFEKMGYDLYIGSLLADYIIQTPLTPELEAAVAKDVLTHIVFLGLMMDLFDVSWVGCSPDYFMSHALYARAWNLSQEDADLSYFACYNQMFLKLLEHQIEDRLVTEEFLKGV